MKKIIVFTLLLALGIILWFANTTKVPDHFGTAFAADTPLVKMEEAYADLERFSGGPVLMQGKITRQCPASGCWFYLDDASGRQVKVELSHLGIKFPQWVGKNARVEGRLLQSRDGLELVGTGAEFY